MPNHERQNPLSTERKREWIADLIGKRKAGAEQARSLVDRAKAEKRNPTRAEAAEFDAAEQLIREYDERIGELHDQVRADEAAAPMQAMYAPRTGESTMDKRTTMPGRSGWSVGTEEETYRPDGNHSYFRDLWQARQYGDADAAGRLARNNAQQASRLNSAQQRAISGNTPGAGGEFVPPLWAESQFIEFARPGRVTASLVNNKPLPAGTDVINLPKINTGSAVAVQTTQNSAVQQTDITTTSASSPVVTIAGGQTLSLQLLEQSPLNMDTVILGDLAADYGMKLNGQVLNGSGTAGQATGTLTLAGTNQIAYTSATPSLAGTGGLYSKLAGAVQAIHTTRFLPPTAVIMHPRRWAWIIAQNDSAYANNMSVFVRLYNYMSFQPARFPQSISVISGTGLITPTF